MLFRRKKIVCYVLIYEQYDIIKQSLDFICQSHDKIEIITIENKSINSKKISQYVNSLGKAGLISRSYFFKENITNNAYDVVLSAERDVIAQSDVVIITDGDVLGDEHDWLTEELRAINDRKVFACGITFSMDNLPVKSFPEAIGWVPPVSKVYKNYSEGRTGIHLLMLRAKSLLRFLEWKDDNHYNFIDNRMHEYASLIGKRWARTNESKAIHLTWDLYQDPNNSYTKKKTNRFNEIWHHSRQSEYTITHYK